MVVEEGGFENNEIEKPELKIHIGDGESGVWITRMPGKNYLLFSVYYDVYCNGGDYTINIQDFRKELKLDERL